MKWFAVVFLVLIIASCQKKDKIVLHNFSSVEIENLAQDTMSIRAIEVINDTLAGFGYDTGYGFINLKTNTITKFPFSYQDTIGKKNWIAQQRAVASTSSSFFTLGIGSPARLRKVDLNTLQDKIVYKEAHPKAFYDAMIFWNDKEGIAMGDPTGDCLSIIITRDGGNNWKKVPCSRLPKVIEGEAAFAASNGNIAVIGSHTWVVSGGKQSRIFYSPDKGSSWEVYSTPLIKGKSTTGAYSTHFYNKSIGVIYGGDYTDPSMNSKNKAMTDDGGRHWKLIGDNTLPGYKSCVRYIPNAGGKEMVAVGFTGIAVSNDFGNSWKHLSDTSFYTLRFITNNLAIAAGKNSIAKITFQ